MHSLITIHDHAALLGLTECENVLYIVETRPTSPAGNGTGQVPRLQGFGFTCYVILLQAVQSSRMSGKGFQLETIELYSRCLMMMTIFWQLGHCKILAVRYTHTANIQVLGWTQ